MDLGLAKKTAFVTGASGGIGQQVARQFAAEGANVVVHFRNNQSSADELVSEIGAEHAIAVQAELSDELSVKKAFQSAADKFGSMDILVANAGVWPPNDTPVHKMTHQQWQKTIDNNATSVFLSCRQFIQQLVEYKLVDPSIVMIGSTAGMFGEAGHADYAASKSALIGGLMLSLKNELAMVAGLGRVNTVCPGWVLTPMAKKFSDDGQAIKKALSTIALRKVACPEDIANAVLFLSSSKVAGHITGQALTVSGGMEGRKLYEEEEL